MGVRSTAIMVTAALSWVSLGYGQPLVGTTMARFLREARRVPAPTLFRDCESCPEMVVIPAGEFEMGSHLLDDLANDDETPQHRVRVGRFALGRYEVTRQEYAEFAAATGADSAWRNPFEGFRQGPDHPVVSVSWEDAQAYVGWLSGETGKQYRLPSEAEWEYAARAGTATAWFWGDEGSCEVMSAFANSRRCSDGAEYTAAVGSYPANLFGLFDMAGNVREWLEDCWHDRYHGAPSDGAPWTQDCDDDDRRVMRGGSWNYNPRHLRSAHRGYSPVAPPRGRSNGIRVARTLD